MEDLAIFCDEVIKSCSEEIKNIPTNFNNKKVTCETQTFYILFAFLLITIPLLIADSIYCYLMKYHRKHLLPFHNTNNKQVQCSNGPPVLRLTNQTSQE